ncbi:prolyl oligopeptidase family serine peptidase [Dietzia timorensis]|nr:prolyl oligopeptidase family serine peptidase [Dietzia timorensis]
MTDNANPNDTSDPHLWLEEVEGADALDFARTRSDATLAAAEADPEYLALERDARSILDASDRIPWSQIRGDWAYNFWRDASHPRGIWRRMPLSQFMTSGGPDPASSHWELLLDVDALAAEEGVNWVYAGTVVRRPADDRALCLLSKGGADAVVVREFDLATADFVPGGLWLDEAKQDVSWVDEDTVAVVSAAEAATSSGYGRRVKLWRRGEGLATEAIWEGEVDDVAVGFSKDPETGREVATRALDFHNAAYAVRSGPEEDWLPLDLPTDCRLVQTAEHLILLPRGAAEVAGTQIPAGGIGALRWSDVIDGSLRADVLWEPSERQALEDISVTRSGLLCTVLDDVQSSLFWLRPGDNGWSHTPVEGLGEHAEVTVTATDRFTSDVAVLALSNPVTPPSLVTIDGDVLAQTPTRFDAKNVVVEQYFAESDDGTRVPYFVMRRSDVDGPAPTVLYGYGGFEIAMTPSYAALRGKLWLERGGHYVVAGIRGGGEYGPGWHAAALREKRPRAYEDFAAVARDVVRRGLTTPAKLGAYGGSNGGLLMGVMLTRYPELFGAIGCAVPLLDMRRYNRLLAGASWMAEYGDPDVPGDWEFISRYSPYQQVSEAAERTYPPVFLTTSTRDDRVHPGHARKMVAALEAAGHDVTYFENTEGGHAGAADNSQEARKNALLYWFLAKRLGLY